MWLVFPINNLLLFFDEPLDIKKSGSPRLVLCWSKLSCGSFIDMSSCLLLPVQDQICVHLFLIVTLCFESFSYPFHTQYPLKLTSLGKLIYSFSLIKHLPLPRKLPFLFLYEGKYEIAFIFPPPPMGRSQGCFIIKLVLW